MLDCKAVGGDDSVTLLIAEDDGGHVRLIQRNLKRGGIKNEIIVFSDGQEVLDFLLEQGDGPKRIRGSSYLLLLDIRMPRVDGVEVLRLLKEHKELKAMPVIMLTTTDDPREIKRCHELGCSTYITKPVEYESFVEKIRQLGLFLTIVCVPSVNGH